MLCRELYEQGSPDLKQNFEQAFNYYYTACNHQIPEAFTHIGNMYKNVSMNSFREDMLRETTTKPRNTLPGADRLGVRRPDSGPAANSSSPVTSGAKSEGFYIISTALFSFFADWVVFICISNHYFNIHGNQYYFLTSSLIT